MVIKLENWDPKANYDRLGFDQDTREICNIEVPQVTIPVKVGRNLEIIIEIAALNFRAKQMGFDASVTFQQQLAKLIAENEKNNN